MERSWRWWLTVVVLPGSVVVATVAFTLAVTARLPDPMAVHWGTSGRPDGSMPVWVNHLVLLGSIAGSWLLLVAAARRGRIPSPLTALVYYLVVFLALVQWLVVAANLDRDDWTDAADLSLWALGAAFGGAVLAAAAGWALAGGRAALAPQPELPAPAAPALPAPWEGRAHNRWLLVTGGGVAAAGLLLVPYPWALIALLAAIAVLVFSSVTVRLDGDGVVIAIGWLGWPRRIVAWDEVSACRAIDLAPMNYGGWGYRIVHGAHAIVIRGGPALQLARPGRSDLLVTVDGAAEAAAVGNGWLEVSPRSSGG